MNIEFVLFRNMLDCVDDIQIGIMVEDKQVLCLCCYSIFEEDDYEIIENKTIDFSGNGEFLIYKLKLEALKHQGMKNEFTCGHDVHKLKNRDEIGEAFGESGRQVPRYIRLTELIYQLLDKVDEDIIKFIAGVEISYLDTRYQVLLNDVIDYNCYEVSAKQGTQIKKHYLDDASEMNGGSVITNEEVTIKTGRVYPPNVYPKFSILNPEFTYTVPKKQMVSGVFDIMSHLMEQYFSGNDDNTTDYIIEAVMTSLIKSARKAVKNPEDYETRSNIMWCATLGLNTVTGLSKTQDWEVHNIEHQLGAYTDCPHGLGLAVISIPYYRYIYKDGIDKFVRFAENVWKVNAEGKTKEEIALEGIASLENFAKELGIPLTLRELGATEDMLGKIAETSYEGGGYKHMTHEDILCVLKECF